MDRRRFGDAGHVHGGAGYHRSQRLAAAHRRQPFGEYHRGHMDAHVIPGGQRDHSADHRMAGADVRPEAPADDGGDGLHDRLGDVRLRDQPGDADCVPRGAGSDRRRAAAGFAGGDARSVSAAGSGQGNGVLGHRHRGGADAGAGAGRLDHGQLQLALDLLYQPAGRAGGGSDGPHVHLRPALSAAGIARHRYVGHRFPGAGHRIAADHARQGAGGRLVRVAVHHVAGDSDGGGARRHSSSAN